MRTRREGFSLIELLVVITIILILLGLLLPVLARIRKEQQITQAKAEIGMLMDAARRYYEDFGDYPPDTEKFPTGDTPDTVIDPDSIFKCLSIRRIDKATGQPGGPYYTFDPKRLKGPKNQTFVDIWGNPYHLDAYHMIKGSDTKMGEPYPSGGTPADVAKKVADVKIWSNGPDGKDSTGSNEWEGKGTAPEDQDNITSWAN